MGVLDIFWESESFRHILRKWEFLDIFLSVHFGVPLSPPWESESFRPHLNILSSIFFPTLLYRWYMDVLKFSNIFTASVSVGPTLIMRWSIVCNLSGGAPILASGDFLICQLVCFVSVLICTDFGNWIFSSFSAYLFRIFFTCTDVDCGRFTD